MTKPWRPHSNVVPIKRLRGLDEFVKPEFVGRMERVARRRRIVWRGAVVATIALGAAIGLFL